MGLSSRCVGLSTYLLRWLPSARLLVFLSLHLFDFCQHLCGRLVNGLSTVVEALFEGRASLTKNFESEDQGLVSQRPVLRVEVWVGFEENIGEADAEVGAVNVQMLLARNVDLLAAGAKNLHTGGRQFF